MSDICSWRHVHLLDNFIRPMIHNPARLFGPYIQPGMSILDIGCGGGFAAIGMAGLVGGSGRVVAVDMQTEMLSFVEQRSRKAGLAGIVETHLCESGDLRIEGRFDFANAFYMVHEVPDTRALLSQVRACLKKNGRFFIAEPKFHVSNRHFSSMLDIATKDGFVVEQKPKVRFSQAVVLQAA